jgi:hypothetical protein
MKLFTGSLAAGLVLLAGGAQAQVLGPHERSPYVAASDFDAAVAPPMVRGPRYAPAPDYIPGPQYGYAPGPGLLPSTEVYSVLRDNGFSPLGIPRLRGFVYTISAIDRGGEDGRLAIDARNGRIIRFVPYRTGDNFYEDQSALDRPSAPPLPQARAPAQAAIQAQAPAHVQAAPRPQKPAAQVASRTVPMPKASPVAAKPAPAPVQQAAAPAPKPTETQAAAAPAVTGTVPAKPEPKIAPTQDMPNAQGLE